MNTVCAHCQAINRVPHNRLSDNAKCGRCGQSLFNGNVTDATSHTLNALLKDSLPVVIDFWAPWCGPCRNFAPIFEETARERRHGLRFLKVNTEAEAALSAQFRIRSIPTLLFFHDGKVIDTLCGALPKGPFNEWLDENIASLTPCLDETPL